ncbi:cilia- and flagella-associated protein 74 isoform X2 [Corythoichthys intestinalis]|uniref:cilia- and flagella-associated protein 74 isoform X2 n=1 Tax=Corythoichthys intestinalis TaxID=161448 RepID=UPI0025A4DC2A|nr:cilia- and flagella-associated protein 74 isoform X2 [Corythoichthys intestinalis]
MEDSDNLCEWDVFSDTCEPTSYQFSSDEDIDGETEEEKEELPDLEWLEELYEENSDDDLAGEPDEEKPRTFAATARMFKLRRNLYQLDNFQRQKERSLLKAREDLNLLRQSIETLLEQRDVLEQEIKHQEAAENSVAVIRLRAQHKNVCYELQREEEIEAHTNNELRQQELALSEFELEVGKFSVLRQEVQEEERVYHVLKAQNAVKRLEQEKNNSHTLRRKIQQLKKKNVDVPEKPDTLVRKKSEDGGANREKGAKYLKETIRRMQQQEAEREQKKRESMQKRIEAVKLLKSNIEATQENLRVRQSRAKANTLKKERQEKRLKESMHAQGLNSTRHIYQQKRDEEVKRQQEEFKERQKARRVEIVDKLLEEQLVKNRKARQAPQPKTKPGQKILSPGRIKERLLRYLDSVHPSGTERDTTLRKLSASGSSSDSEYQEDIIEKEMQHLSLPDSLEEPEFCGLWDQSYKLPLNEKKTAAVVCPKLRKTPKKGVGKQIKGPSFTSKPEVILFKDFEVGETYKKKVILTNISNITNHCKFLEISAQLQDFIIINFQPPGPLSTGMSCEMHITFHPSINEDLEGEVAFASAESNFFVAVKCTIKRCDLEVDSQFIDFGSHVVGQTILRTITLTNKGALATRFSLDTTKPVPEIHQVQIPSHCSADTQQDTPCADQNQSAASIPTSMDHVLDRSTVSRQCQRESQISTSDPRAASVASSIHSQIQDGLSDSCDIRIGNVREGDIGPFESVKLEIIFSPTVPGEVKLDLYIKFSDPTSYPIAILVKGEGVGLPVWVVEPNIDMKICMFDRLYQEEVTLQSSTSTALKLTFDLWPEMRKHMEIIPRTGFLQAQSSFTAHLKFLPRNTLPEDADKYFDSATGVLEVPMAVQVAGQVQPVIYTVQAIVTSSDLNFDQSEVDFGYCSIYQSVKSSVRMTNMSLLPQEFGFVGLPEAKREAEPNKGKKLSKNTKLSDFSPKCATPTETTAPDNIEAGGQRFEEARASLLHSFTSRYNEYTIPCFVSDGDPPEEDRQAQPAWSPLNTLYLKLQCPAVQPPLVVVSSNIRNYALDFQQVAVGERVIKRFSVQNISEESLELRSSLLDIYGPFLLLNALRAIGPGEKHTLALAFCPTLEKKYCETLEVRCHKMTLAVTLRGEGVVPAITSSHSGGLLDFGYVLEKESTSHVLKLQNSSTVAVGFKAMLYSLTPSETRGPDERVAILLGGYTDSKIQPVVGTQNYNGLSVFSVLPVEGSIAAKQSQDVIVTFHPDHPSVNYSDQLTIELVNKSKLCVLDLKGAASSHNMYLQGGDQLAVPIESLLPPPITSQQGPSEDTDIPVLVTLRASYSMGTIRPAVRELQVGCIRPSKKGTEFTWDNLASMQLKGFNVDPNKASVEAGTKRAIKLTWTPLSGHKPNEVVQMCVPLTIKGEETRVYQVTLMALVCTHVN